MNISAVVVTRGDVDLTPIKENLKHFDEVLIWDNSKAIVDLKVYGRYVGAQCARNSHIYIQDDDCIVDSVKIAHSYEQDVQYRRSSSVYANFPENRRSEYRGSRIALLGWGTLFTKEDAGIVFRRYLNVFPQDDLFLRECDRVFSFLMNGRIIYGNEPIEHLPHAHGADRMGKESRHRNDLMEIKYRLSKVESTLGLRL